MTSYQEYLRTMKFINSLSYETLRRLAEISDECRKNNVDIVDFFNKLKEIYQPD